MPQTTAFLSGAISHIEKQLLSRIAHGDEQAYKQIFNHYWDSVYSASLLLTKQPELAEDITQEVFAKIWELRTELVHVEKLEGFLFITARNMIYSRLRKEATAENYIRYIRAYFSEEVLTPDLQAEAHNLETAIRKGIQQLPPQQQRAFILSRFQGLSHADIAREMKISKTSVKSYIVQAIAHLKKDLTRQDASFFLLLL